jgi:hypothetical protein
MRSLQLNFFTIEKYIYKRVYGTIASQRDTADVWPDEIPWKRGLG